MNLIRIFPYLKLRLLNLILGNLLIEFSHWNDISSLKQTYPDM